MRGLYQVTRTQEADDWVIASSPEEAKAIASGLEAEWYGVVDVYALQYDKAVVMDKFDLAWDPQRELYLTPEETEALLEEEKNGRTNPDA